MTLWEETIVDDGHGSMVVGLRQSKKAIEEGRAQMAYLAKDTDSFVSIPFEEFCSEYGVRIEYVESKASLGKMCHIDVDAAVAAKIR